MISKNPTTALPALKPPCLKPGSTLGLVGSSLPLLPSWKENYEIGKKTLQSYGFQIREGRTIGLNHWWSAGTATDQAADISAKLRKRGLPQHPYGWTEGVPW